nr:ABC transporter ATP-binding protein [uncultured Albidiferax sp.]
MTLELKQLGVAYAGTRVVRGLDLVLPQAGQVVALVGANGAGKSSTLRAIAGLCAMSGQAWLDGDNLGALRPAQRTQRVAYMPQSLPQATGLTVYEAMLGTLHIARPQWSSSQVHQRIAAVLADLGLEPLAMRALGSLSGGQRQMAGLAQLLARAPRLLLLDEPTSALDLRWQLCLLQALRQHVATHNTLCLMAIHDLNLAARFCDHMLLLADGRLLASGSPGAVLTPELLRTAYGVQARVEACSLGSPMVLAEQAIPYSAHPT